MVDLILSIFTSGIFSIAWYWVIDKSCKRLSIPLLFRINLSLALGFGFFLCTLSALLVVLPYGFTFISRFLFIVYTVSTGCVFFLFISKNRYFQTITKIKNLQFPKPSTTSILLILFSIITGIIYISHPVIDSDIVESYLPLARSIIRIDSFPTRNYYNNNAFIVPPVGGPALFAFYYAITGNTHSEAFRFINIPFIVGFLLISFSFFRFFLSKKLAKVGVLILLIFPLFEDQIFQATLYVDFIFLFYFMLITWILTFILMKTNKTVPLIFFPLIGLSLSVLLLLKFQALFVYVIVYIFLLARITQSRLRYFLSFAFLLPLFAKYLINYSPFGSLSQFQQILFTLLPVCATFSLIHQVEKSTNRITWKNLFVVIAPSLIGFIFLVRIYSTFGGFTDTNIPYLDAVTYAYQIGVGEKQGNTLEKWGFFIGPALAFFWFVPKAVGVWQFFRSRKFIFPLFVVSLWYCFWVLFLGAKDTRWLLPTLPFITLGIILGFKKILFSEKKVERAVWASIPFKVLSSKFLFWNLGVLSFGTETFRHIAQNIGTQSEISLPEDGFLNILGRNVVEIGYKMMGLANKLIYIFTSRTQNSTEDAPLLVVFSILTFILLIIISKNKIAWRVWKGIVCLSVGSYFILLLSISRGSIRNLQIFQKDHLFDYWGLSTYIVPYLQTHASSNDIVFSVGSSPGLSYYTNLRVFTILRGGGISAIHPIFHSTDDTEIVNFLKREHIRYIAVLQNVETLSQYDKLKKITRVYDVMENVQYSKMVLDKSRYNSWRLYELE